MNIKTILANATHRLKNLSETARLDAEILLSETLQVYRTYLHTWPEKKVTERQQLQFENYIKRREKGEPVAYIVGHQAFWKLDLIVNRHTLIPRPETELLVELILEKFPEDSEIHIADLGTGSGAIALALANERPVWNIMAIDASEEALIIAQQNADRYQLENVHFAQGHWCDDLPENNFHVIVSNPPYVSEDDPHLLQGDLTFEPRSALVADREGLGAIEAIINSSRAHLRCHGCLLLEHGYQQGEAVIKLMKEAGFCEISKHFDLAGHWRVTTGRNL